MHTGVSKEFLLQEYERALRGEATPDCREAGCVNCGVCNAETKLKIKTADQSLVVTTPPEPQPDSTAQRFRLRMRFCKQGELRLLSQLDISRTMIRAMRRAEIPVSYSQGFHPHPKISFGTALPVGIQSRAEYMDVELGEPLSPEEVMRRLNNALPAQLQVTEVKNIPVGFRSLAKVSDLFGYHISIPCNLDKTGENTGSLLAEPQKVQQDHIHNFLAQSRIMIERADKQINIRPAIIKLELLQSDAEHLELELILKSQLRPQVLIQQLYSLSTPQLMALQIERIGIWTQNGDQWYTPLEVSS
jgi:radical SAM-linked protein